MPVFPESFSKSVWNRDTRTTNPSKGSPATVSSLQGVFTKGIELVPYLTCAVRHSAGCFAETQS